MTGETGDQPHAVLHLEITPPLPIKINVARDAFTNWKTKRNLDLRCSSELELV
nr:unnamed protein product [Callosobruchus chinensis]